MFNNTSCSSPDNFTILCSSLDGSERKSFSYFYARFAIYIIIVILSPVAMAGNALILAAIWKKTFHRASFHVLLSGLASTDLCTGLITQPLMALSYLLSRAIPGISIARPVLFFTVETIGDISAVYFVAITLLIMTLMAIERWLHMSRRSLVASRRGCLTAAVVLFIPIPLVVFAALDTSDRWVHTATAAFMLFCFVTTSVAYFKVFRIIRQYQQQVQGNQSSQSFGQPAINLAKYKKSVVTILYILALFSFCFLPLIVCLVVSAHVGEGFEIDTAFYGGPQLSREKLIPRGKRKLLTVKEKTHGKKKNLAAKRKTSRQKEKDSRQKEKDSRQKEKDPRQKEKPRGKKKNLAAKRKRLTAKRKRLTAKRKTSRQKETEDSRQKEKPHGKKKKTRGKKKRLTGKRKTDSLIISKS